jgi:hypothetical protein
MSKNSKEKIIKDFFQKFTFIQIFLAKNKQHILLMHLPILTKTHFLAKSFKKSK